MKKLNIIGAKTKMIKIEVFENPDDSDILYALTDGRGNYSLSKDNSIWWADKSNKHLLGDGEIDGNPVRSYKGNPLLQVAKVDNKLGIWDTNTFQSISGPFDDMDELIKSVYVDEDLGVKIKHLDFDKS